VLFDKELEELNKEEINRKTKGGNLAMSFAHDNLL